MLYSAEHQPPSRRQVSENSSSALKQTEMPSRLQSHTQSKHLLISVFINTYTRNSADTSA